MEATVPAAPAESRSARPKLKRTIGLLTATAPALGAGAEPASGRGGPRCMSRPLEREELS